MSQLPSIKNSKGFTLLEVLVAMVIFMVGMLGLLESINMSLQYNLSSQLRDESVRMGEKYMAELRGRSFDTSATFINYSTLTTSSNIRGTNRNYSIERTSQPLASDINGTTTRQLTVSVKYGFRNQSSLNRVVSVVTRP